MLSAAKSANVGIFEGSAIISPPTNPAYAPHAKKSFYKFGEKKFRVSSMCA